jgi:hypothetical protein
MARTKFSELRNAVMAKPGATKRLAALRVETLEEITQLDDPPIGVSLEETPEALRAAARPIAYGHRQIVRLTREEADAFVEAINE